MKPDDLYKYTVWFLTKKVDNQQELEQHINLFAVKIKQYIQRIQDAKN